MRSTLAAALLIGLVACGGPSASKADCTGFHASEAKLQAERADAQTALKSPHTGFLGSPSDAQARYDQAARAYAELFVADTKCSTPEERARARADLDGLNR